MMHCRLLCGPGLTREVRNDYNAPTESPPHFIITKSITHSLSISSASNDQLRIDQQVMTRSSITMQCTAIASKREIEMIQELKKKYKMNNNNYK